MIKLFYIVCTALFSCILTLEVSADIDYGLNPAFSPSSGIEQTVKTANMVVLIDDMGYSLALNKAALSLPGPLSFAFLPFARYSRQLAIMANQLDKNILLHAPMENIHGLPLGPGGMTAAMSESEFKQVLNNDINAIPHLVGVNNHMGSQLTTMKAQMRWTMEVLLERGLFFVDSKTTAKSVAWRQAKKAGMVGVKRDVFLDNELNRPALQKQFAEAMALAKKQGYVVLIAHPHAVSINFLRNNLARLAKNDINLISLSSLVNQLKSNQLASSVVNVLVH